MQLKIATPFQATCFQNIQGVALCTGSNLSSGVLWDAAENCNTLSGNQNIQGFMCVALCTGSKLFSGVL
jgi:hypothetical protein